MPIGTGIIYNVGDLILSQVSGSGTSFLETKIAAATSSIVYFDSTARINSASLNSITVGTASYVSGSTSIITNLTASNISASGTSSFGYVGIGTVNPSYKLDVQPTSSTVRFGQSVVGALPANTLYAFFGHNSLDHASTANNYALLQFSDGTTYLNASSGKTLNFRIANADKMVLDASGKLGIGTTAPLTGYLDVRSSVSKTSTTTNIAFFGSSDAANPLGLAVNHESSSGIKMVGLVGTEYGVSGNNIKINEILHVQYAGNVGIATTSPAYKLDVIGPATSNGVTLRLSDAASLANSRHILLTRGSVSGSIGIAGSQIEDPLWLSRSSGYDLIVASSGNIGIGTSIPGALLEISSSTAASLLNIKGAGGNAILFVSGSGKVGIGTTSPGALLDVSYGDYQSTGTVRIGADLGANTSRTNVSRKWGLITGYNYTNASAAIPIIGYDSANTYTAINIGGGTSSIPASPTYISFFTTSSLSTYGAERVRIISDGNVGIGTTVPGAKLHIEGQNNVSLIKQTAVSLSNGVYALDIDNLAHGSNMSTAGAFRISTNANSGAFVVNGVGNVGIGTTSPGSRLEVQFPTNPATDNGAGNNVLRVWTSASFAADVGGAIGLGGTYNTSSYQSFGQIAGRKTNALSSSNSGYLQFATVNNGGTMNEQMRIDASGNLLIGKTDTLFTSAGTIIYPSSGLDVIRDGNPTLALNRLTSEGRIIDLYIATSLVGSICGLGGGGVSFNTSTTEKMRIASDGNVGIGTTSVSANLVVGYNGTVHYEEPGATNVLIKGKTSNARALLEIHDAAGVVKSYFQSVYSTGLAYIGTYSTHGLALTTGGTEKVRLDTNGNVGIGTTSPKNKLHVAGLVTLDSTIIYSKVNNVTTNDPIRITIPFTKINTGADFIVKVKAVAMTSNGSGVNYLDYVGYSGYTFNFNVNLTTIEKLGNVVVNSYVSASSGTAGNLYVELNGDDGYLQDSNWTIQTDIMGNSMYSTFDSGSITTFVTSISEDILETSFNKYFGGNVGIGTTSPGYKLDVSGSSRHGYRAADTHQFTGSVSVSGSVTAASFTGSLSGSITSALTASYLTPANSYTITNLTSSNISASLTGSFGIVGIGTNSPTQKLDVAGSAYAYNYFTLLTAATYGPSDNSAAMQVFGSTGSGGLTNTIKFVTGGSERWRITDAGILQSPAGQTIQTSTGNLTLATGGGDGNILLSPNGIGKVGIGTTIPAAIVDIQGANVTTFGGSNTGSLGTMYLSGNDAYNSGTAGAGIYFRGKFDAAGTTRTTFGAISGIKENNTDGDFSGALTFFARSGSNTGIIHERMRINSNGNVGIGTTSPAAKLEISGSSNSVLLNIKSAISGAILYVSGSGAVGIGTSNVGAYTLQVSGSFAATTKSFVIEHPTKAGKKLIYGSLESPYHGIRLTGRDTLVNGKCKIQLPDYIYKLILHDSVNIQLTGIKCNKTLYVDEINIPENYFTIAYDKAIFESYKDYDFFWDFTAIRADVPELITEL